MEKQKRIKINHGYATVSEDCSQETIDMINRLADAAYNFNVKEIQITKAKITINPKQQLKTT